MDIEDLIRTAQAHQAERAVPADRIRAGLPDRMARAHRRRLGTVGAVIAAVAVAAAITIPALTVGRTGTSVAGSPAGPPVATASALTSIPPLTTGLMRPAGFPLGYRPTWAPSGFAERIRTADIGVPTDAFGPTVSRVWKKKVGRGDPWGGAELTLVVRTEVADAGAAMDTSGRKVEINGTKGYYTAAQGDHKSYVSWSPDAHTLLTLSANHLDISQSDLLRMARSVQPERGTVAVPVHLRWLPTGWATTGFTVSGASAATWRGEVAAARSAPEPTTTAERKAQKGGATSPVGSLSVVVGSTTDAPTGGETLSVDGHPARHPVRTDEPGQSLVYLVVDLGQGRLMTLVGQGAGIGLTDLVKIAEQVSITPAGLDWLGH